MTTQNKPNSDLLTIIIWLLVLTLGLILFTGCNQEEPTPDPITVSITKDCRSCILTYSYSNVYATVGVETPTKAILVAIPYGSILEVSIENKKIDNVWYEYKSEITFDSPSKGYQRYQLSGTTTELEIEIR